MEVLVVKMAWWLLTAKSKYIFLLYPARCLIVRPYVDSSELSYTTTLPTIRCLIIARKKKENPFVAFKIVEAKDCWIQGSLNPRIVKCKFCKIQVLLNPRDRWIQILLNQSDYWIQVWLNPNIRAHKLAPSVFNCQYFTKGRLRKVLHSMFISRIKSNLLVWGLGLTQGWVLTMGLESLQELDKVL